MAAIITNKTNTVEIVFNELTDTLGSSRQTLEKGSGNRLDLSPDKTYIELVLAPDGRKIQITGIAYTLFQDSLGNTYANMEELYLAVSQMMENR